MYVVASEISSGMSKTSGHIKKTGTHSVKVSLAHNVVATVALSVVSA